jgi:hypothetical protein
MAQAPAYKPVIGALLKGYKATLSPAFVALGVLFVGADALAGPGPGSDGKPPHAPWLLALGLAVLALFSSGVLNRRKRVVRP